MANDSSNDINRLIDMLYEKIESAKVSKFNRDLRLVDSTEVLELLDELRAQLPTELKQAQDLMQNREKFIENAKQKAEKMIRQAELEAKTKVSESEILYAAKDRARQIITQAEDRARKLYQMANEYAEDALSRTEEAVQAALGEVRESRARFRAISAARLQEQREKLERRPRTEDEED